MCEIIYELVIDGIDEETLEELLEEVKEGNDGKSVNKQ